MKELIYFKGLNCYNNSIITIANERNIDYNLSFHNLWSEIDFDCNNPLERYASKRLYQNLAILGIEIDKSIKVNAKDFTKKFSTINIDEYFIVSMDSYFIPWNDIYQIRHDWHYFIVQNIIGDNFLCFDPTYNLKNIQISKSEVLNHVNEICKINTVKPALSFQINPYKELNDVILNDNKLKSILTKKIIFANENDIRLHHQTANYIDVIISNRYLFKHYLSTLNLSKDMSDIMPENYFLTWLAVKNGLNKMSLIKNETLCQQITHLIQMLLQKEIGYANQLKAYTAKKM